MRKHDNKEIGENVQEVQARQLADVIRHNLTILDETSPKYMMEVIQLLMSTYMTKYYMLQTGFVPRPEFLVNSAKEDEETAANKEGDKKGPQKERILKVL